MRSADDNLVPSDKDLEHLLRKAQKSAAKKEAYKKTTKQYYSSVYDSPFVRVKTSFNFWHSK